MVYTPLSNAPAGFLVNAAWMNLYLRDNLNAINGGGGLMPTSAILWWPAEVASIPDNWLPCDGTLGVVDLRDRILVGAGSTYAVHDVGGAPTSAQGAHTAHSLSTPDHSQHTVDAAATHAGAFIPNVAFTAGPSPVATAGTHTGGVSTLGHTHSNAALTDTHAHAGSPFAVLPPYLALTAMLKNTPTVSFPTPRTWSDGDVPTAAMFNQDLRDAFQSLRQRLPWASSVLLWSGAVAAMPSGFQLCDGTNGSPDMRDHFNIAAGVTYAALAIGGATSLAIPNHSNHAPTQADAHGGHGISGINTHPSTNTNLLGPDAIQLFLDHSNVSIGGAHSSHSGFAVDAHGTHAAIATIPPYIALAYIQLVNTGIYTAPRTWSDGESVDQARLNTYLRDNESALYNEQIPLGAILAWHNSIASIPAGYSHCEGSGGRPDTRDKFIVGAGSTYAVNGTGGATTSTPAAHGAHAVTQPSTHGAHSMTNGSHTVSGYVRAVGGGNTEFSSGSHNFSVAIDTNHVHAFALDGGAAHSAHSAMSLLPPYHALAFIQRTT